MKKIILGCIIIILLVNTACENKMNGEVAFEPKDIQQMEQTEQESQPVEQQSQESQPVESQPVEPQPVEPQPVEPQLPDLQWPKDFIPGVPMLQGEVRSLIFDVPREGDEVQEPQYTRIELANIEESTADQFIEGLKAGGYTQNAIYEKNDVHTKYYVQQINEKYNGYRVYFKWNPSNKSALAVLLKPGWLALSAYLLFYDDTTDEDLSPWPENFIPNYPEPKGKIIDVTSSEGYAGGTSLSITLYYGDRQSVIDCIEEMRKRYFVEAGEVVTDNSLMYDGVSKFYDGKKFDSASIGFEDISDSPYIEMAKVPEGKYRIITVSMFKAK